MHVAVLAASGATGRHLAVQALDRGHSVTAIARDLARLDLPTSAQLHRYAADVQDPSSLARALIGTDVVVSGLGSTTGSTGAVLTAGAQAAVDAATPRIVWLGAYGTGVSARPAGVLTRVVLALAVRAEIADKVAADTLVLDNGGTVFHAGPLTNGPLAATRRTLTLTTAPRRLFPRGVSRATVAAAMLDEAETGYHRGQVLVPLDA